jgi:hypothetical protein
MRQAKKRDLLMLREWISRPDLGGGIAFSGNDLNLEEGSVYDDKYSNDLITLTNRSGEDDPFTRLLAGPVFHRLEKIWRHFKVSREGTSISKELTTHQKPVPSDAENPASESNLFHYSDSHVLGAIDILGTVIASMTPLVSIIILYFVENLGYRLAILCACTLIFSISLTLVTKARRIEIFACTAA